MSSTGQRGFCSCFSGLVDRAMCAGTRRGSSESYYRELGDQETLKIDDRSSQQSSEESVEFNELFPKVGQIAKKVDPYAIDDVIASLDDMPPGKRLTGQFMTTRRERRRGTVNGVFVFKGRLAEDLLPGQLQCMLRQSHVWNFNAFRLDNLTGGRCLPALSMYLFQAYGLTAHFKLDTVKLLKLFHLIEEGYRSSNPYHNSVHAADVTQAMHCFLQQRRIRANLEPLEVMASLLAAIAHDMDHPGVSQPYLVATSNHLVKFYKSVSVLENHHWRAAVSCILQSGIFDDLKELRRKLVYQMSSLILATDITRQQEYLNKFRDHIDTNTLDMTKPEHRHLVLQIALKCADISNPCRPWQISRVWSHRVCEEFFRQGDCERDLNIEITALCDRYTTTIPRIQSGFFRYIVAPLIAEWHRFLKSELSAQMLENLIYNQSQWEKQLSKENGEDDDAFRDIIDAVQVDDDLETTTNKSESSEHLLPKSKRDSARERPQSIREQLRRFSAPLNVIQDSTHRNCQTLSSPEEAAAAAAEGQQPDVTNGSGSLNSESNPLPEKLKAAASDLMLNRRRKSLSADDDAGACSNGHRERRVREKREVIPELLRRTLSGKECWTRRRGSAPAPVTSEGRGTRCRLSPLPCQWVARATPRRSSLPAEVMSGVSSH